MGVSFEQQLRLQASPFASTSRRLYTFSSNQNHWPLNPQLVKDCLLPPHHHPFIYTTPITPLPSSIPHPLLLLLSWTWPASSRARTNARSCTWCMATKRLFVFPSAYFRICTDFTKILNSRNCYWQSRYIELKQCLYDWLDLHILVKSNVSALSASLSLLK